MRPFRLRNLRQTEKWKRQYNKQKNLQREINKSAQDILNSDNFRRTKTFIQHGNMTVNNHCMNVAKYSLSMSKKLEKVGIKCETDDLIRGALLHDYFLYDWHDKDPNFSHRLHGFYHPGIALRNAQKEYDLTEREQNIIKRHMWPLTLVPPNCKEAWIVTTADKWCSLLETFHLHKGHGIQKSEQEN